MGSMTERERTKHLLAGVDVDLSDLEEMLEQVNTERQGLFQAKEDCKRHAQDLPEHPGVPTTEVTASSIMSELQAAMTANSANIAKRQDVEKIVNKIITLKDKSMLQYEKVVSLEAQLEEAKKMHDTSLEEGEAALKEHEEATAGTVDLVDIPTDELQQQLEDVDQLNQKIRQNSVRAQKFAEADGLRAKWNEKEEEQNQILFEMKSRVESADIPLPGLSIDDKLRVTFDDMIWSNCSSMQHMVVETAIASLYNKAASFVLADGLEALDLKSQSLFHRWAISRGLQVICTVVKESFEGEADDGRCRVLISDGKNV